MPIDLQTFSDPLFLGTVVLCAAAPAGYIYWLTQQCPTTPPETDRLLPPLTRGDLETLLRQTLREEFEAYHAQHVHRPMGEARHD